MAKNIKDRTNRQNVQRILTIIQQRLGSTRTYELGICCFVGINEYSDEICELVEPDSKITQFYYSCANKFHIEPAEKYIGNNVSGVLVFANGNECLCYQFVSGQFVKLFGINGHLIKSHKKGGFSANRFARLADESRHNYIVRIADRIRDLINSSLESPCTPNKVECQTNLSNRIWIFGSDDIVQMFQTYWVGLSQVKINSGGFLNFNSNTINNNQYWLEFLSKPVGNEYERNYEQIKLYLDTNPDMLDFDKSAKSEVKFFIEKTSGQFQDLLPNQIPFPTSSSKFYLDLVLFEYVGVKYFANQEQYLLDGTN